MSSPGPTSTVPSAPRVEVVRHTLPNGLDLFLLERRTLPLLSITLLLPQGVNAEGPGQAGLSHLAASLLPQGTRHRDAVRLAEDVDALGASLGVHSDYDYTSVGLSCLARDAAEAISILAEVISEPALEDAEILRKRSDVLALLERRKDDATDRVRTRFAELLFGAHPYHHPRLGYPESVNALTNDTLRDFCRTHYHPRGAMLSVVGDFEPAAMLELLTRGFGPWQGGGAPVQLEPPIFRQPGVLVETIQKDDVAQATLRVGGPGFRRDHPDYAAANLLNYVLGGSGFGSRLMKNLREEKGLTYGAYSSFHTKKLAGAFLAGLQTSLDTMNAAMAELLSEITRMRDHGITQEELEWAKRYFTGSLPLSFQTNDQLANHVLEQALYDLEPEFWLREMERMKEATLEQVNAVATRYLRPETFTVVVLGDFRNREFRMP